MKGLSRIVVPNLDFLVESPGNLLKKEKKRKEKLLIKFYPYRFKLGTQQVFLMYSQV